MKRTLDEIREIEAMNMANCLMLLSSNIRRSEEIGADRSGNYRRIFECITCNRQFSSFQALGGHRASHKKPRLLVGAESLLSKSSSVAIAMPKIHECSVCGVEFPTGQALGGHMRRHRTATIISPKPSPLVVPSSLPVFMKSNGKRVLCLDLNLTPFENDLNLQFGEKLLSPSPVHCFL